MRILKWLAQNYKYCFNMQEKIKEIIDKLSSSLDNHSKGWSARKLSALAIMICVISIHVAWARHCVKKGDWAQLELVLTIDYAFIASMLGLTTYQAIKTNKPNDNEGSK